MRKFKDALQRFFYGRNGIDSLNKFIFFIYIISFIVYLFVQHISIIIIQTVLLVIYIFRMLSKKLYNRQRENEIFVNIIKMIKQPFLRLAHRIRDRKTHSYKKCPNCKKVLRLKKIKGTHTVKCPVCFNSFKVKI